jgi:dienelactone hydrolase
MAAAQNQPAAPPYAPTEPEKAALGARTAQLGERIAALRKAGRDETLLADVEVYRKAAQWIARHPEEFYTKAYYDNTLRALDRGTARAEALEQGRSPWTTQKGRVVRAYRSGVDDSVQPYAVHIPDDYDPSRPIRLDVVLHGRGATLNEVSFLAQHEQAKPVPLMPGRIELHVFGRTNNAYRWAGETDVFEALASVESRYKIDPERIVLRGFSMGGAGAWHIGLHHPDRWAAVEAGAGFNETLRYARQKDLPPHQAKALHIYDAYEYALNALNVPVVGYGGEIDPQLQASLNIQEQLRRETIEPASLRALFLVGPKTEHRWHPDSKRESEAFIEKHLPRRVPDRVRFVTYTTRYNRAYWLRVDALERHYERAEMDARRGAEGVTVKTSNVARFSLSEAAETVIDGQKLPKSASFEKRGGKWRVAGGEPSGLGKRHGLQGPIDDAFMSSFLVVVPTGSAQHAQAGALAERRRETFLSEYAKWMRGDPRSLKDEQVTDRHAASHNLILFGDPSSNRQLRRYLSRLPVTWNQETIRVGARTFPAASHLLAMIYPNPSQPGRYIVINSGHTFGEREFRGTNALLFPRLGDWAVLNLEGETVAAGMFDENWKLPRE